MFTGHRFFFSKQINILEGIAKIVFNVITFDVNKIWKNYDKKMYYLVRFTLPCVTKHDLAVFITIKQLYIAFTQNNHHDIYLRCL